MTVLTGAGPYRIDAGTAEIMSWRRTYPGRPDQAGGFRRFLSCLLVDFPGVDEVVMAAAELFDNAVQHSDSRLPGGEVTVEIRRWPGACVTLAVADQGGSNVPVLRVPGDDPLPECGRGLLILDATTARWGWHGDARGRTVTALFLG